MDFALPAFHHDGAVALSARRRIAARDTRDAFESA
jgi:hypothetical protein